MAARPGAILAGTAATPKRAWVPIAVVVAVAAVAAACSGTPAAPKATETAHSVTADSSAGEPASAPVDPDDQPVGDQSGDDQSGGDGGAGATGGESEGAPGDGAAGMDAPMETVGTSEPAEGGALGQAGADGDGSEQVTSGQSGAEGDGSGQVASGQAGAEGGGSEGAAAESAVFENVEYGGLASEGYLNLDSLDPRAFGLIAPLTGSITTELFLAQRRPVAVKVGNGDPQDHPQAGLAAADIVYEVLVEAGKTRFIAVFHSEIPTRVGPVRSVRSSDFDILEDLATPYLVSSGANSTVQQQMRQAARAGTLVDVGAMRMAAPYTRDRSRRAPHNLYFYYENLGGADPDSLPGGRPESPPAPLFEYDSPNPPGLADAAGVTVAYTTLFGEESSHVWDPILGGWVRIQDGALHIAETDFGLSEIAPANVVVVQMPYDTSAADRRSPQALSYGSGDALVLTAGSVHEAVWERTEDRIGFRFADAAGNPLSLSSGATWVLLANTSRRWPLAEVTVLTASEGARLLADSRAAAEAITD